MLTPLEALLTLLALVAITWLAHLLSQARHQFGP